MVTSLICSCLRVFYTFVSNDNIYFVYVNFKHRSLFSGHHSLRKQPGFPLDVRLDDAPEDLTAEAHSGRDHQAHVRGAPDDSGHVGADETPRRCLELLSQGD